MTSPATINAIPYTRRPIPPASDITQLPHLRNWLGQEFQGVQRSLAAVSSAQTNTFVNVKDPPYNARGDGVTDDWPAFTAAMTAIHAAGGGMLYVPPGTYIMSATLAMLANITFAGAGWAPSILKWATTGAGLKFFGTINVQNLAKYVVRDLTFQCTNASNTDGGIVDVGGTFVQWINVHVTGFKYGGIMSQTELAPIIGCNFELQLSGGAGLWLANGGDYNPGADVAFTNRIAVENCQFNENATTTYGVVDDGGYAHYYGKNNFNASITPIRAAGLLCFVVEGANYFESHGTGPLVSLQATTFNSGTGVGNIHAARIVGNMMNQTNSQPCVLVPASSVNGLTVKDNYLQTNGVALSGLGNAAGRLDIGPNTYNGSGSLYDGTPFELFVTLANGANNDVVLPAMVGSASDNPFVQAVGLTGAYNITGFVAGFPGQRFTIFNRMGFDMTLNHNNAGSAVGNRIDSLTLADVVIPDFGMATLVYDHTESHWMIQSTSLGAYSGTPRFGSTYVVTAPAATGYIPVKDSTGTVYKVLVST